MKVYLETHRLKLVQFEAEDASLLLDLDSDPEVMRFISGGVPSSEEHITKVIETIMSYRKRFEDRLGIFKSIEKESGEFMGWFHLRPGKNELENLKSLELGYRLKKKFWGNGFATEGSKALVENAFHKQKADEVWARTLKGNLASQNIMKKIGMRFVCDYLETEVHGPAEPAVRYSILVKDLS